MLVPMTVPQYSNTTVRQYGILFNFSYDCNPYYISTTVRQDGMLFDWTEHIVTVIADISTPLRQYDRTISHLSTQNAP